MTNMLHQPRGDPAALIREAHLALPPLNPLTANLLAFSFACIYVGSLYISNRARLKFETTTTTGNGLKPTGNGNGEGDSSPADEPRLKLANERWRDDPSVIRARLIACCVASVLCCLEVAAIVLWRFGVHSIHTLDYKTIRRATDLTVAYLGVPQLPSQLGGAAHWLFSPLSLDVDLTSWIYRSPSTLLPHLVLPTLFLGPLYTTFLAQTLPSQKWWRFDTHVVGYFATWVGIRSYIIAPITEEIVFRACVLAVCHMAHMSPREMVFGTPWVFGVAHVHHAWDTYNRYGRTTAALQRALLGSAFQFAYTSLFGFLVAYLYIKSGSLYPCISAHVFCNIMGFPEIAWELRRWRERKGAIIAAYLLGIVAFVYVLPRWSTMGDEQSRAFWALA